MSQALWLQPVIFKHLPLGSINMETFVSLVFKLSFDAWAKISLFLNYPCDQWKSKNIKKFIIASQWGRKVTFLSTILKLEWLQRQVFVRSTDLGWVKDKRV